jgi:hypothetical protein
MSLRRPNEDQDRPSRLEVEAAVSMLAELDAAAFQLLRTQLLRWGDAVRAPLLAASEASDVRLRLRARHVLRALDVKQSLRGFRALDLGYGGRRDAGQLLQGAVLLTQMTRTFAAGADELQRWLHHEAELLRVEFTGHSLQTCARILSDHLAGELGFRGGDASCLEPDHVLLDRVLHGRVGIPVSISLVYLLIARLAGLSVAGVGMPDHFLVRLHGVRPVLVDPFHGGRAVTKADCVRYLRAAGFDHAHEHLRDLSDREVLAHYLRSLRRVAVYRGGVDARATLEDALSHLEAT